MLSETAGASRQAAPGRYRVFSDLTASLKPQTGSPLRKQVSRYLRGHRKLGEFLNEIIRLNQELLAQGVLDDED